MKIKIINKSNNETPKYESEKSAGMDIRAFVKQELLIKPLERVAIPAESYPLYSNFFKEFMIDEETGLLLFIPIIPHIVIFFFFCNF